MNRKPRIYRDGEGRPYQLHRGRRVPVISGADPLEDVLGTLQESLDALNEREEQGEDVGRERKQVESQIAQKKAEVEDRDQELQRLRAEKAESQEREVADRIVQQAVKGMVEHEQERRTRIESYVTESVQKMLGGAETFEDALHDALHRPSGISRFVGPAATSSGAKAVAEGGYQIVQQGGGVRDVKIGGNREVDALRDSKSIAQIMVSLKRVRSGYATPAEREWIEELGAKALAEGTASAGGVLVPQEWMPDVLGLLRAQAVVRRANPRVVPFDKLMNQTSISTGATAYYTAENAAMPTSEPTFAEVPLLTPKNLTGLVPVSNYLLRDAPQAESIVRQDLAEVLALREDLAFLRGTGAAGEPKGFRNIVGITLNPVALTGGAANGFAPSMEQLKRIRAIFRAQNAGGNVRPVWFFHPDVLTYLETLEDTLGRPLLDTATLSENEDGTTGRFLGHEFFTSTQIPNGQTQGTSTDATEIYLVNMAEAILGINQDLELDVSDQATYTPDGGTSWISAFQNNQSLFRAVMRHDLAHRRPNQIIRQDGIRPSIP